MKHRQIVMKDLLEQVPLIREKKVVNKMLCGGCRHFPLNGKREHFCRESAARVRADDTGCIFFQKRKNPKVSRTSKTTKLPPEMWKPCEECGRWLKTAASIQEGVGHGCKRKREKEEK